MAPVNGSCDWMCFNIEYDKQKEPIGSCAHMLVNYSTVHTMDVNLTEGYNLIIIPEEKKFPSQIGDIFGFQRGVSGAVLERVTTGQSARVYHAKEQFSPELGVFFADTVALNFSFRVQVHGSISSKAFMNVSCAYTVGVYPLMAMMRNEILPTHNRKPFKIETEIAVQNRISNASTTNKIYIAVNVSKNITVTIAQGTNITCEWRMWNSSSPTYQTPHMQQNTTTEGVSCSIELPATAQPVSFPVHFTAYNGVSNCSNCPMTIKVHVREIIEGLRVEKCNRGSFAYKKARLCLTTRVAHGTHVWCNWQVKKPKWTHPITKSIGKKINPVISPVGNTSITVNCYNGLPEVGRTTFSIKTIPSPLSFDAPRWVAVNEEIQINCSVSWPSGSSKKFFAEQGLTGQNGTEIGQKPLLELSVSPRQQYRDNGSVTLTINVIRDRKVTCKAVHFPDLNMDYTIRAMNPIAGVNITTNCTSRFEVATSCEFQVQITGGENPHFQWNVSEKGGDVNVLKYTGRTFNHRFRNPSEVSVSVNVSNEVSWMAKTIHFVAVHSVPLIRKAELRHTKSGFVDYAIVFSVANLEQPYLCRFLWDWDDQSELQEASSLLTHTYNRTGQYNVSVKISTGIDNVVLSSVVVVRQPITVLQIRDIALGLSKVLTVKFEIFQSLNATYAVDFGDNSGMINYTFFYQRYISKCYKLQNFAGLLKRE